MLHILAVDNSYTAWLIFVKNIGNYLLYPNIKSQYIFVM